MAQMNVPPGKWHKETFQDFTGGENRMVTPEFLQPNQLLQAVNCVYTADGVPQTRPGKTKINSVSLGSGPPISVHRYAKENGNKYLVVQHGTSLYYSSWDGQSIISSFTQVKTGLSSNKLYGEVWKDQLILGNGVDNTFRFDGTACTDLSGAPLMKFFKKRAGRLWGIDAANPNHLRYCDLENYDSWPALNLIKVRDGDGDVITGLAALDDGMIISKRKSLWPLYGTNNDNLQLGTTPIDPKTGCHSHEVISDIGVMMGPDGLYKFNLSRVERAGDTHSKVIKDLTNSEKEASFGVVLPYESQYIISLGSGPVLCVDARYNAITTWSGLDQGCFTVADAAGDFGDLIIGDKADGWLYLLNNQIDDGGVPIQTVIQTPYSDMGLVKEKVWKYFRPEIEPLGAVSNIIYLQYDLDYSKQLGLHPINYQLEEVLTWGTSNWDEANWGANVKIEEAFWLHKVRGDRISFTITASDRIKLNRYSTKYREVGAK